MLIKLPARTVMSPIMGGCLKKLCPSLTLSKSSAFHPCHWFCAGWTWDFWPNQDLWGIIRMDWNCLDHLEVSFAQNWRRFKHPSLQWNRFQFLSPLPQSSWGSQMEELGFSRHTCWGIIEPHILELFSQEGPCFSYKKVLRQRVVYGKMQL